MSTQCHSKFLHLKKLQGSKRIDLFIPAKCKSWGCEDCRKVKAKLVKNFILRSFANQELWMLTFTFYQKGEVLDTWKKIGERWNRFRTWATKKYGKFLYVRVVEPHKKGGWPHLHVLVNVNISEPQIRKNLKGWGFGYIFDKMKIDAKGASSYLSGYLTKKWPGTLANSLRSQSKTRIVQASQSLGSIFNIKSQWTLVDWNVDKEKVFEYVWDVYKEVFINHRNGARLEKAAEHFQIESHATKADRKELYELNLVAPEIDIETAEIVDDFMVGIQQDLFLI